MTDKTVFLNIEIPKHLKEAAVKAAKDMDRSLASFVREAIRKEITKKT